MRTALVLFAIVAPGGALRIAVTGAGGQTGGLVFRQLLADPKHEAVGFTRSAASRDALLEAVGADATVAVNDVTDVAACAAAFAAAGPIDALVICTSAKPKRIEGGDPDGPPTFHYPNGTPEEVDWFGQKNQIDAACAAGAHVVLCSSMGGTNKKNPLNALGNGKILLWKRKAEEYLLDSPTTFAIVHPGGLTDEPGGREIIAGVDDEQIGTESRSIPRADVAAVLVAAATDVDFKYRCFDIRAKPAGEGTPTPPGCRALLDQLGNKNCDYSIGHTA